MIRRLGNPQTWLAICLTIILTVGGWDVVGTIRAREQDARNLAHSLEVIRAQQQTLEATAARVAELEDRIQALTEELQAEERQNSAQAVYTARQIQILKDQVRRMNGRPIIINPPTTTTTRPTSTTTTTRPTTTTTRRPTTTTTRCFPRVTC